MRLHILVEGQTEEAFVRDVLGPHLCAAGWHESSATRLTTKREGARLWKGGVNRYSRVKADIELRLKQQSADVRVTTMIDLYALPTDFPQYSDHQADTDAYRRIAALEAAFAEDIGDPRFIPHLQLHEFEALLLVEPIKIADVYGVGVGSIRALSEAVLSADGNPELVNDGPTTAPSKRIIAVVPQYEGDKASVGPLVAAAIGLEQLRQRCSHFAAWLGRLEQLVQPPPS